MKTNLVTKMGKSSEIVKTLVKLINVVTVVHAIYPTGLMERGKCRKCFKK